MRAIVRPPFTLRTFARIDSTNDEARRNVAAGHGTVFWAHEQTAGRGRRGRTWGSPPGNLYCSFLLDAGGDRAVAPQLTFVGAVALRDALAGLLPGVAVRIKWPNDILCGGDKVAGMLLEWSDPLAILGVGVNVAGVPDLPLLFPATCLAAHGCGADAGAVLTALCDSLAPWYTLWRKSGFAPVRAAWLEQAAGIGAPVKARLADESVHEGVFHDLDADGALILETDDGTMLRVLAGDVFF